MVIKKRVEVSRLSGADSVLGQHGKFESVETVGRTDRQTDVTICFVIPLIEMETELEPIVNHLIKFKISTSLHSKSSLLMKALSTDTVHVYSFLAN